MKHTPGPWTKVFPSNHWHIARTDGRVEIAKVAAYKQREVSTANARLITAAPELLSALERLAKRHLEANTDYKAIDEALRAIAKAKGEAI